VPRNVLQGIAYARSALMTIAWLRCGLIHDAPSASRGVMRPRLRWLRLPRIFAAAWKTNRFARPMSWPKPPRSGRCATTCALA